MTIIAIHKMYFESSHIEIEVEALYVDGNLESNKVILLKNAESLQTGGNAPAEQNEDNTRNMISLMFVEK